VFSAASLLALTGAEVFPSDSTAILYAGDLLVELAALKEDSMVSTSSIFSPVPEFVTLYTRTDTIPSFSSCTVGK
jgi:hypothetical protein